MAQAAHDGDDGSDLARLAARATARVVVAWTPELRERAALAAPCIAILGPREERTPVRVLDERTFPVRLVRGSNAPLHGLNHSLVLVAVEGERAPRWIDAARIEDPT